MGLKVAMLALLALPDFAMAQFQFNEYCDVLAGFRKTGSADTSGFQMVANLGDLTNYLNFQAGTTVTITNFTPGQLTDSFGNYNNLQWSVFASFPNNGTRSHPGTWASGAGTFPVNTVWYTLPISGTNLITQTSPPYRQGAGSYSCFSLIYGVGGPTGASTITGYSAESVDNTNNVVKESEAYNLYDLTAYIGDAGNLTNGDFGANSAPLPGNTDVENDTANFTSPQRSDFYQVVPSGDVDPITGSSSTNSYYVGSFVLNPNGTMNFTRAFAITQSASSGTAPLSVTFTNSATSSSITNWVWNFGNGTSITNSTDRNVTNSYATAGNYTVTLTVEGPGGAGSQSTFVVVVTGSKPTLSITQSSGQFVINGTNAPASTQYRILSTTNLLTLLPNWKAIYTNTAASNGTFSYTNTIGNTNAFFIMVSP
jgi:hypothetical protein